MRQCAIDVVQQPIQGMSDDSHFVVLIGVLRPHPDADPMVISGEWHPGDFPGGRGDTA